ncbi:SDR family NAD(P)-dependent oxidoreductase [Luteibacter flocculans]|uniref:SDR family NAD(P)-dependent oxidoreductase n=1 Tax=Luteibacter flocculans TaxID=2780091 RepID=A0ABY4T677_9GAMM|nr:SDR family NAD(P)-dependent oxidoreductase [Luteibacter flocculans]URL60111.1 SDR family NAD(P)-dependent oxidoreductase [Luteibacter flocculans]
MTSNATPRILIVGASRGLGLAMVAEFLSHCWAVTATVRESSPRDGLDDLSRRHPGKVGIEQLDMNDTDQLAALDTRLDGETFDILFVNAGVSNRDPTQTIGEVSTEEFIHVMVTNALSPMRVVERLVRHVTPDGLIGVMSSGQGSITNNTAGQRELYRGTKAALNMYMRSFAAREANARHPMVVMAPGWVRTELGGEAAPLTIEDSIPRLVQVLLAKRDRPGLEYLDYQGRTVPW